MLVDDPKLMLVVLVLNSRRRYQPGSWIAVDPGLDSGTSIAELFAAGRSSFPACHHNTHFPREEIEEQRLTGISYHFRQSFPVFWVWLPPLEMSSQLGWTPQYVLLSPTG